MFNFQDNAFLKPSLPDNAQVIIVSDMFVDDYVGGAELTTEALVKSSPFNVHKLHSKDVTMEILERGVDRFWIFGNFTQLNPQLIPTIVGNLKYCILEYDYKYCRFRSPEKHAAQTNTSCDCAEQINGKLISAFFHGSMCLWWMSEAQKDHYQTKFPFLSKNTNHVLSSVFDDQTLVTLKWLRNTNPQKKGWVVLGSNSWIKGADAAEQWCKDSNLDYEVVWNLPYEELLQKLASAEGFVYLPQGMDTCPRMVIEAKLLGCKLHLNDYVQHKDEEWFNDDIEKIEEYLYASRKVFWDNVKSMIDYRPTISGYTTTFNCTTQGYPFEQCIKSMLQFCDEVCVVDGGSTDDTWTRLEKLASDPRIKIKMINRDWSDPQFAVFDGQQKAEARAMCTKEFCWQMDSDEIVHELDASKIQLMIKNMPKEALILALPVVEYWGGPDKVRIDVTPWKWRLSKNDPNVTHGVPGVLRVPSDLGTVGYHAKEGTDGCDMIFKDSLQQVPFVTFYTSEIDQIRKMALLGNEMALMQYQTWFNNVIAALPGVFHYSWFDLKRKICLYRDYWTKHWNSLYGKSIDDNETTNMMFDVPWSAVSDEMIEGLAIELKTKLGGWIWHKKWDRKTLTPSIVVNRSQPQVMLSSETNSESSEKI